MFMQLSSKINSNAWAENYNDIVSDYRQAMSDGFHFDYKHEIDISDTSDIQSIMSQMTKDGYFWQITPLIFARNVVSIIPEYLQKSKTVEILMSESVKPVLAIFSTLEPKSEIDPHIDTDDEIVTGQQHIPHDERETHVVKYHMGLDVPNDGDSCLVVGDVTEKVEEGKILAFDETITHYAYNRSSKKRGVLIVSYLHNEIY
jgi:hypothetical protein